MRPPLRCVALTVLPMTVVMSLAGCRIEKVRSADTTTVGSEPRPGINACGITRRTTLHHQAYRTADSLGVGTRITRLLNLRSATGLTERNRLYAVSPAYCGLRFMLVDPAPRSSSAPNGRGALRRLAGETQVRELEIVGCTKRR